jgi:hypothetical protein
MTEKFDREEWIKNNPILKMAIPMRAKLGKREDKIEQRNFE